jgi:hypothetical protein
MISSVITKFECGLCAVRAQQSMTSTTFEYINCTVHIMRLLNVNFSYWASCVYVV